MAQAPMPEGEVSNIADNRPRKLEDNQKLVEMNGAIYLQTTTVDSKGVETVRRSRVDSQRDPDARAKGVTPWYVPLLKEARAEAAAEKKAAEEAERERIRAEVRAEIEAENKKPPAPRKTGSK